MFTRLVEITTKHDKSHEMATAIREKVIPILQKQPGFIDETVLVSDAEPNRVLALSFWKKQEDAQRYHDKEYKNVREAVQHLMDGEPQVRTFDVHSSTLHKIASGKAA
jgi:quinol monooxygenase YgiN